METTLLVMMPLVSAACAIAAFFIARFTESHKKGQNAGLLKADIDYIKEKITDIREDLMRISSTLNDHLERITRLEESAKAAHKRLDEKTGVKKCLT